jgi:exonuclease III
MDSIHVVTWNMHGIKSRFLDGKLREILHHKTVVHKPIFLLQEVSMKSVTQKNAKQINDLVKEYGYNFIHEGKVGMLIPENIQYTRLENNQEKLSDRLIAMKFIHGDIDIVVINVYVPNNNTSKPYPRDVWSDAFHDWLEQFRENPIILGGDFNTCLTRKEVRNPYEITNYLNESEIVNIWTKYHCNDFRKEHRDYLQNLLNSFKLIDTFKEASNIYLDYDIEDLDMDNYEAVGEHYNRRVHFEYFNEFDETSDNTDFLTTNSGRLDYIFVSKGIYIKDTCIGHEYGSDHKNYSVELDINKR